MRFMEHLKNVPIGVLIGFFIGIAYMALLGSSIEAEAKRYGTYTITAIISLFASGVALAGVFANLETQYSLAEQRRQSDLLAARSVLPLALTKLIDVADAGFNISIRNDEFLRDPSNVNIVINELSIDTEIIEILQNCIRSSDETSGAWISHIISHYQVYRSRLVGLVGDGNRIISNESKASSATDWIVLKAMIEHTYNFARGDDAIPDILDQNLIRAPIGLRLPSHEISKVLAASITRTLEHYQPMNSGQFSLSDS